MFVIKRNYRPNIADPDDPDNYIASKGARQFAALHLDPWCHSRRVNLPRAILGRRDAPEARQGADDRKRDVGVRTGILPVKPIDDIRTLISDALVREAEVDAEQIAAVAHTLHPAVPLDELRAAVRECHFSMRDRLRWPKSGPLTHFEHKRRKLIFAYPQPTSDFSKRLDSSISLILHVHFWY